MIAKKQRLKKGEIDYLLKKGQEGESKLFITRYENNKENFSKYCVIISGKISGKATVRNKLRRRIYEALRELIGEEVGEAGSKIPKNVVLIPKKQILKTELADITKDLKTLLKKL